MLRKALRHSLLLIALSCLGFYAYASAERLWTDLESRAWLDSQNRQPASAALTVSPTESRPAKTSREDVSPSASDDPLDLAVGDPVGRLDIPALGVDGAVEHGETETVLRRAIGHLPGSSLPGDGGHVVLAGHRDSFFRGLRRAAWGQEITLSTPDGDFVYRIDGLRIVGPNDIESIAPTPEERLTLVTCYPFDYVGAAPRRFLVTAGPTDSMAD